MSGSHSTPSTQHLPSSDDAQLLPSPPKIHFSLSPSLSPPPRAESRESRESDWVSVSSQFVSPIGAPKPGPSSATRRPSDCGTPSPRKYRETYWPRKASIPRSKNVRTLSFEDRGGKGLEGGCAIRTRADEEERVVGGAGSDWGEVNVQTRRKGESWFSTCGLVLIGMSMIILCVVGGFLGVWFGVLAKGRWVI